MFSFSCNMTLLILFSVWFWVTESFSSVVLQQNRASTRLDNQRDCRSRKHKVSRPIVSLQRTDSLRAQTRINESQAPWEGRRWGETLLSIVIQLVERQNYTGPAEPECITMSNITACAHLTRCSTANHGTKEPFCWTHCHGSIVVNNGDGLRGLTLQPPLTRFERVLIRMSIWYCLWWKSNPVV